LPVLASGAKNIIVRSFDVKKTAELIDEYQVTNVLLSPAFLIELWDYFINNKNSYSFKSLRNINVGSAALPGNKWKEMINTFGPLIQQNYGMAEVLAPLAFLRIANPGAEKDKLTSVGKIIKQVKIKLIDVDSHNYGIICLSGKTTALGYWKSPCLTQQQFRNGWFITEDIGYISKEGFLHVIERTDNAIVLNGEKIFPRNIEEVIYEFPGIKEVAVILDEDRIVAYISVRRNYDIKIPELKQFCNNRLPTGISPSKFILLDNLPHSTSGKILKEKLNSTPNPFL
jgi:long-chain acyl-CoA synthetase